MADATTDVIAELVYTAWDMARFGQSLGVSGSPFGWDEDRRELLQAELHGRFFHIYGIERDNVDYIIDSFPVVHRRLIRRCATIPAPARIGPISTCGLKKNRRKLEPD